MKRPRPRPPLRLCWSTSVTQLEQDSCINIRLATESEREGVRELRWPWKKDRERGEKEEVSEVLFLSFPESCLSLNGGKEAQKNCVERRAHGNYFITLAHSRLLRASEFCECVCEWSRSTKPSSQPQSDFPRRAPNTSSHCNILCCTDLFFHDIFSYFGSCSLVLPL